MSSPPLPDLDALSADGLKRLVARLLARVAALEEENRQLRDENARLKDLPKRPKLAPGGMDRATEPASRAEVRRRRRAGRGGKRTPPATEERVLTVAPPPGSRRKGYQPYTVQDLVLAPRMVRYRRERWVTPDGREIVAPLPPEVAGHFGPGIVRFALMQHVQGQVTVERLLAQLRALGVRIAKGQLVALLTARKDAFHAETDAILEAGLATARWLTVDDTGARHAGREETTTHVGDARFAWFAIRPSKSRFGFLTHALCWVHAERHLRRVVCVTAEQQRLVDLQRQLVWWLYADLKLYKDDPTPARRAALRARFDRVFGRVTGFADLDATVARLRANKAELLLVLDRPEIPLHTNGSESDIRCFVTKRKISGETRSAAGKRARDTFLGLLKTCAKLVVSFWDYLGARLKVPDAAAVPWLPDLIRQRASAYPIRA